MLLNSNVKLLLVLLLAVVLIHMLNTKDEIPNEGEVEALTEDEIKNEEKTDDADMEPPTETVNTTNTDESMIDTVLGTDVQPNDVQNAGSDVNELGTSVTAQNMQKLVKENENNKLKFDSSELLPQEVNKDWFESDFSHAQVNLDDSNLVVTDRYIIGVNTVGQSLKNPSYDIRASPACPKFTVSPWQQSTIEPDFNIKNIME